MSSRPAEARRGVSRPAMSLSSTGLREETRSPTGTGPGRQRIIRTDGSKPRPFFRRPQTRGKGLPTWSPDGTHVGFAGCRVRRGRFADRYAGIYVADADGSNLHLVTSHAYNEYGFAWSPDGRWILYGRANREGIYVIGADGRNNHRLTRDSPTPSVFPALTWAPDGRSIAYETDRTGNGDIYVIGADGHNKVRLTSSPRATPSPPGNLNSESANATRPEPPSPHPPSRVSRNVPRAVRSAPGASGLMDAARRVGRGACVSRLGRRCVPLSTRR